MHAIARRDRSRTGYVIDRARYSWHASRLHTLQTQRLASTLRPTCAVHHSMCSTSERGCRALPNVLAMQCGARPARAFTLRPYMLSLAMRSPVSHTASVLHKGVSSSCIMMANPPRTVPHAAANARFALLGIPQALSKPSRRERVINSCSRADRSCWSRIGFT